MKGSTPMTDNGLKPVDNEADDFHDECGVFGIFGKSEAAAVVTLGLHALQHRGQEAAGIVAFDGKQFSVERHVGLLGDTFTRRSVMDRLPGELSGGQKQRICIARALAADPEVIICDEVTSALDQIVQEGILKLLLRLQKELNITYLFITHDIAVVTAISDEIVVMFQGQVVEQGLKSKILSPPFTDYTQLLLSSVPEMDPDWLDKLVEDRS